MYQVIYKIPGYITKVRAFYEPIVEALQNIPTYMDNADFVTLAQQNGINAAGLSDSNKLIDLLYNFDKTEWTKFTEIFPNLNEYVARHCQVSRKQIISWEWIWQLHLHSSCGLVF